MELFTSQGCSSCPDADALLSRWGMAKFKEGTVIPLAFDVDYWNYLGWKDLFSTPAWSQRQRRYAATLGSGVYTPQIVVAGRAELAGSDESALENIVARLSNEPAAAQLSLSVEPSPKPLTLKITVTPLPALKGRPHLMLALFENGLSTRITSGENRGSTLRTDFVVRRLEDLGPISNSSQSTTRTHTLIPDPAWKLPHLGAAAFLQDPATLEITASAAIYPAVLK